MKRIRSLACVIFALSGGLASAANIMFDFGPLAVGSDYYTLSPGHSTNAVSAGETSWNHISSMTPPALTTSNGGASAVTLVMGQEASGGNNIIDFTQSISNLALEGNGGAISGRANLLRADSIYGLNAATSTAVGRDGFFGGYTTTNPNAGGKAIGLRLNGLEAGQYIVYVMARNTNSNAESAPMVVYANVAASNATLNFSSLTAFSQSNPGYASTGYTDGYSNFVNGENYVAINVTIAAGEALFVAVDGGTADGRGFLNMLQVVQVPEPGTALLGVLGGILMFRRRRLV